MNDNEPNIGSTVQTNQESSEISPNLEHSEIFDVAREALTQIEIIAANDSRFGWLAKDMFEIVPGSSVLNLLQQALYPKNNMSSVEAEPYALNQVSLNEPITVKPAIDMHGNINIYQYLPTTDDTHYAYESVVSLKIIEGSDPKKSGIYLIVQGGRMLPGTKRSVEFGQNEKGEYTMLTRAGTHEAIVPSSNDKTVVEYVPNNAIKIQQLLSVPLVRK